MDSSQAMGEYDSMAPLKTGLGDCLVFWNEHFGQNCDSHASISS